jgi:soluble lytic murein transglycosylase-like protein
MAKESAFNAKAVSSTGAIGLGQIKPFNYKQLGIQNPYHIDQNVRGVVLYLKEMLDLWNGNLKQIELALASYTEGPGQIKRSGGQYTAKTAKYIKDILEIYKKI